MNSSGRRAAWLLAPLFAFSALLLWSQEFRATVNGKVTDPSGAGVPDAKIVLKNSETNEELTGTSTSGGNYTIPFAKPGRYSISVESAGFKRAERRNLELRVNDVVTVDLPLEVGQVAETMTVTGEPPILDEATASRGAIVDQLRVVELPLNGRNPITLANLAPGVVYAGNPQFIRPFDNGDNINFSINGGLRQTNSYLIDGAPDDVLSNSDAARNRSQLNIGYIPIVDTTQEFRIQTNFYDAQYGRTGGGIVNITTKSGTNELHGAAYDFLRRYQWDANSLAANAAGRPRYGVDPVSGANLGGHKLDQTGVEIGGPVILPKIYNGRDKTFWMFGFENYLESTPSPILTTVPTLAARQGDFSAYGVTIYDPLLTTLNPNFNPSAAENANNSRYIRAAFPGNIIPSSRFNSAGLAILNAYPVPNVGGPNQITNNFIASPNLSQDTFRNYIGRVDQNFGSMERMFFRYAHNRRDQFDNGSNGFTGIGRDAQDPLIRVNDNAVVDSVTVLSPRTILDIRASFTRYAEAAYRTGARGFDPTQYGFTNFPRFADLTPYINVSNLPNFGTRNERQDLTNVISLQPSLSIIKGKNSIKAGLETRDIRSNTYGGSFLYAAGQFSFDTSFTQQFPQYNTGTGTGQAIAALLLGTPSSGVVQYAPAPAFHWNYYALYIQDDIRLTSKLSINIGLRWDLEGTVTERYNRMNRGFDFNALSPLAGAVRGANASDCPACANGLTGGLLFAGVNGQPRGAFKDDWNNWQPRIGAAYSVNSRTVIRGGYGVFYLPVGDYGGTYGFSVDTPFTAATTTNANNPASQFTPATFLNNPFPQGLLQPTGSSQGLNTFLGQSFQVNNPNRLIPHVRQYSAGIERQLPGSWKLEASYVGSRSVGINTGDYQAGNPRNINVNSASQIAQAAANPQYFSQVVANPFAGLIPNVPALNGATIARQQLLKPYPQFGNVTYALDPVGKLWYDALQVNVEKRYSAGFVFTAAYTFSKNLEAISYLNDQDAAPTKNVSATDRPNRLVLSSVYQLPFGHGKRYGSHWNRALDLAAGGWEYNVISVMQTGTPIDLPSNVNLLSDPANYTRTSQTWFNPCVQQTNGTSQQPTYLTGASDPKFTTCSNPAWQLRTSTSLTLRTIPFRIASLRNPYAKQWDMSLSKKFRITERVAAQFRAEGFNVFNTPIRSGPDTNPTSTTFGLVPANQSNFPRQVQLGFKAIF